MSDCYAVGDFHGDQCEIDLRHSMCLAVQQQLHQFVVATRKVAKVQDFQKRATKGLQGQILDSVIVLMKVILRPCKSSRNSDLAPGTVLSDEDGC